MRVRAKMCEIEKREEYSFSYSSMISIAPLKCAVTNLGE